MDRERLSGLLQKYGRQTPRYTSYPPITVWGGVTPPQVDSWLGQDSGEPLSLYLHVPFCRSQCLYCGCSTVITKDRGVTPGYLAALLGELSLVRSKLGTARKVTQVHFGGGTPTYLSQPELAAVVERILELFRVDSDVEIGIELDPRTVSPDDLKRLRATGFNRISLGVQDFDPEVQARVHRRQPPKLVSRLLETAHSLGIPSVNFDLIYGLPLQTVASFDQTLDQVLAMGPDRIALYPFAYLPQIFAHQGALASKELPDAHTMQEIFIRARERLTDNGYCYIGMDHFAREHDALTVALRQGTLRRNFMGYTMQAGTEVLGFGTSAISEYRGHYWQNEKNVDRYEKSIAAGTLPVVRGMTLSADDLQRKDCIRSLMCEGRVDLADLNGVADAGQALHEEELLALEALQADGLVQLDGSQVNVTEDGRLFLRAIAYQFDAYAGRAPGRTMALPQSA